MGASSPAGAPPSTSAAEDYQGANSASTTEGTPSNISIVTTSKEEALETANNGPPSIQEFDYPDGGLRGEYFAYMIEQLGCIGIS